MGWKASVLMVLCVALAGCAENAPPSDEVNEPDNSALDKGVLRGVVVDPTIRPLASAAVAIKQNGTPVIELTTDQNGEFGVPGLPAGDYTINASKPGFISTEMPALVVGGENRPPLIEIVLRPQPVDAAFVWPIIWDGMVTCGTTFQNWCAAINLVAGVNIFPDESFRFLFDEFMEQQRTPDYMQVEIVWEPNNDVSRWAYGAFWASTWDEWEECLCTPNILAFETGETYILVQLEGEALREFDVGFSRGMGVGFSAGEGLTVFGNVTEHPERLTVMVNQPFEAFMHVFYGCLPDEGWLFTEHGDPSCDPESIKIAEAAGA